MIRGLCIGLMVFSLLLGIGIVIEAVRSHWICDEALWVWRPGSISLACRPGRLIVHWDDINHEVLDFPPLKPGLALARLPERTAADALVDEESSWRVAGFAYANVTSTDGLLSHTEEIELPDAALLLIFLGFPAALFAARVHRRRLRKARHLCARCGYDLRATPSQCPECGAVYMPADRVHPMTRT